MAKLVDKVYGQALFDLSVENNQVDAYTDQVQVIARVIDENPDLLVFLNHPQIAREEKISMLKNCFEGKIEDELTGFLLLIVEAGRQKFLPQILQYFLEAVKAYKHIGVAYVTTAVALRSEQKTAVEKRLLEITDHVGFEMHFDVDESLLGGMVIRIGDKVADSSIKTKLAALSKELLQVQI